MFLMLSKATKLQGEGELLIFSAFPHTGGRNQESPGLASKFPLSRVNSAPITPAPRKGNQLPTEGLGKYAPVSE